VPSRREVIQGFLPHSPLVGHLGLRLESIGTDEATLVLPFRPELATIEDIVHGGAIASLIDTAGMAATWADDAEPETATGSTVALNVNYLSAARSQELIAHAVVTRRGRNLVFSEVRVTDAAGRLVATGSVVQRLG
jgi:uncharacterized protein (TIGR00369 family)